MSLIRQAIEAKRSTYYFTPDGKLAIFHASYTSVEHPRVDVSVRCSECGPGFYAFIQPKACYWHRNRFRLAVVNLFYVDVKRLELCSGVDINTQYGVEVYAKGKSQTHYYRDMLFWVGSGGRFVSSHGGQFFTKNQQFLDMYVEHVDSLDYAQFEAWYICNPITHVIKLNADLDDILYKYVRNGLCGYTDRCREKFNRIFY